MHNRQWHAGVLVLIFLFCGTFSAQQIKATDAFFAAFEQLTQFKNPSIAGYRIQLVIYSDYKSAKQALQYFQEKFPQVTAQLDYQVPYHRLRVGGYRHKYLALADLKKYKKIGYSGAFIIPAKLQLQELYSVDVWSDLQQPQADL